MDEIICPICGRGNTLQAVNCRYCQAPSDKTEKPHSDQLFESTREPEFIRNRPSTTGKPEETKKSEEIEPEWLKRIRELKKADEEQEREKEKWRQQSLFGQGPDQKSGQKNTSPARKAKETIKTNTEVENKEKTPAAEGADGETTTPAENLHPSETVDEPENTNGLPDGYEPFPDE